MAFCIKTLNSVEDLVSDRLFDVFDPLFHYSTIPKAKNVLITIALDKFEFFVKLHKSMIGFTFHPLPNSPELVSYVSEHFLRV